MWLTSHQVFHFPSTPSYPPSLPHTQNLVGPGEVDDGLQPETASECAKFGAVAECVVYECPARSVPPEEAVRVFVMFHEAASAVLARESMDGRFFGGRRVSATYYSEEGFAQRRLAPNT